MQEFSRYAHSSVGLETHGLANLKNVYWNLSTPDVPDAVLIPRNTWEDSRAYDAQAQKLAGMFNKNFKQFEDKISDTIKAAAPKLD